MKNYFKLMRIHHYIKNLLVFAALACSGQLFNLKKLIHNVMAFIVFCLISSVIYIVNDIRDREKDKKHPKKCHRPIASGEITVRKAWILAIVLLFTVFLCNRKIFQPLSTGLLLTYFVLNLAYSFGLKDIPIIDVAILVSGFLIRILYGALVTGINISNWLYLTVIASAFYFALGKRRNELKQLESGKTRKVLIKYNVDFLEKNMTMCLTLANVFYALWSMDTKTASLYKNEYLIFSVPVVLLITLKYSLDVEGDSDGDPVEVLLNDKALIILCGIYLATMFAILYLLR